MSVDPPPSKKWLVKHLRKVLPVWISLPLTLMAALLRVCLTLVAVFVLLFAWMDFDDSFGHARLKSEMAEAGIGPPEFGNAGQNAPHLPILTASPDGRWIITSLWSEKDAGYDWILKTTKPLKFTFKATREGAAAGVCRPESW